jgi:hypothetical protein
LAGVSERLQGSEFAAKSRLAAGEIRVLFFGHRLHGRSFETGDDYTATFTADSVATISGDWGSLVDATVAFAGDEICFEGAGGARFCASILRNPGGSHVRENEYIWLDGTGAYPFSQIE